MANYTLANLVKDQTVLQGAFASQDVRFRTPEVWKLFLKNTENFLPNYKESRTREDRVLEAIYNVRSQRALGSERQANHTGSRGDAGVITPAFTTKQDKFSSSLKQADISVMEAVEQANNDMLNAVANFMEGLEAVSSTALFSNRTGVNVATSDGAFSALNDVFEITESTNGDSAPYIAKMVMDINKYQGVQCTFVCDSISYRKFMKLANQGTMNATNTAFQFSGIEFVHDPTLTTKAVTLDVTYTKGFWIVVPANTIGALTWIPRQNRQGVQTTVNTYGSLINPFDGQTYAFHSYEERADDSANNGYTQDVVTQKELSIDVALEIAPLSVATETTLFAFALI